MLNHWKHMPGISGAISSSRSPSGPQLPQRTSEQAMKWGFLYATKKPQQAMGSVVADAKKDEDVGVARLNGIIEHHEGSVTICKVPRIQHGGSRRVQMEQLKDLVRQAGMVSAV